VTRSTLIRALFLACIGLYPVLVYFGLSYLPPSFFGIALLILLAMRYGILLPEERPVLVPLLLVFVTYAVVAAVSGSEAMLLYYPVIVSFSLCGVFLNSLRQGDPLLFRIVQARGYTISEHTPIYLYRLTAVWAAFFVANGLVSLWTTTLGLKAWTLYNGFLSYVAVAVFVGIEYTFRCWYKRRKGIDEA
jgi:uncharacterized membrane protein